MTADKNAASALGLLLGLGTTLAVWMAGGVLLGHWCDRHFTRFPVGVIGGAILGLIGSGYTVLRIIGKLDRKKP